MNIDNKLEIMYRSGVVEIDEEGTFVRVTLDFPNNLIGSSYTDHSYEKAVHGLYRRFKADLWAIVQRMEDNH